MTGNADAARLGAILFARKRDGRGRAIAATPEDISAMTISALERRSAELVLEAAFAEDGLDGPAMLRSPLVQRALENRTGTVRISLGLDRPVIGLGASAPLVYPAVGRLLSTEA